MVGRRRCELGYEDSKLFDMGRTVMNVEGASALPPRYSAIKHIHLLEGRGGFEGETHRIMSSMEAIKREKAQRNSNSLPTPRC